MNANLFAQSVLVQDANVMDIFLSLPANPGL